MENGTASQVYIHQYCTEDSRLGSLTDICTTLDGTAQFNISDDSSSRTDLLPDRRSTLAKYRKIIVKIDYKAVRQHTYTVGPIVGG